MYAFLRPLLMHKDSYVSGITKLEVLGYRHLTADDKLYLEGVFATTSSIPVSDEVIDLAISLRQSRKMSLGDSIIAATALLNGCELYTNNTADFVHIPGLIVVNPLAS
nr:type II toxin-antitoxin system VapC family toxin [Spirosoma rhododendri]